MSASTGHASTGPRDPTYPRHIRPAITGCIGLALAALVAGWASLACAQESADPRLEDARARFREGVEAADEGRWEDARLAFEATYALLPRPVVLLNLAGARAQTGHLVDAVEAYRAVADVTSGAPAELREAARSALASLEPRVPRVRLAFHDTLLAGDELRLDDQTLEGVITDVDRPLDPGRHGVVVRRAGSEVLREEFRLYEGERLRLDLRVPPPDAPQEPAEAPLDTTIEVAPASAEWWESPVFWTVVGVVVAGSVGVGVAVAVGSEEPFEGNLAPGSVAVH